MHLRLPTVLAKLSFAIATTACLLGCADAFVQSAEFVRFRVRGFERAFSVADLETYVSTGIPSQQLRWYLNRLSPEQQAQLRQSLTTPLEIDAYTLLKMTRTPIGDSFLRHLLPLFGGDLADEDQLAAVRAALLLAADEGSINAINLIRKYPLTNLRLDLNAVVTAIADRQQAIADVEALFAAIQGEREIVPAEPAAVSAIASDTPITQVRGPLEWQRRELTFQNPRRDSDQWLVADVYLPQDLGTPAPLIVMSHGLANDRHSFVYAAEHLASHGFAVASIQHPDTDYARLQSVLRGDTELPNANLFLNRPGDIFALLDSLEQMQEDDTTWLSQINTQSVGLFGQSLGGYTVLAAGGARFDFEHLERNCQTFADDSIPLNVSEILQCQLLNLEERSQLPTDDRIAAIVALNPVGSAMFGPQGMAEIDRPIALVASSHDLVTPAVEEQVRPFTWLNSEDRYLLYVTPASHVSFVGNRPQSIEGIPSELLGPDSELAYPVMSWFAASFFDTYINGTAEFNVLLAGEHWPANIGEYNYALTQEFSAAELEDAIGR
ncbi:MAG: alpha/beta hydrolase [Cyanobacteria bacterium P01_E01_bin.34]